MGYKRFDILTLEDDKNLIILEILEYNGNEYLYVDELNENEDDILGNGCILIAYEDGTVQKETDPDTLITILPLFSRNIKLNEEIEVK